jgi:hypothetical protein
MQHRGIADAVMGGGALSGIMLENGLYQKWVPSPWIWREIAFPLDYELGRPHLEKGENGFFHREVPSSDKEGV